VMSTSAPGESCGIGASDIRTNDANGVEIRQIRWDFQMRKIDNDVMIASM